MQVRLKLEYDGTNYSGWQTQNEQDSIQARLEEALARLMNAPVRVHGAGRTDAGVHARGQSACVRLPRAFGIQELVRALNSLLPDDIAVIDASEVPESFDPRRDARLRVYEYRVLNRPRRSVFERNRAWLVPEPLSLEAMSAAAGEFLGEHDFAAFRSTGSEERTTVRRIESSRWVVAQKSDGILVYRVEGTAFLRHMVRTMVSAMIEVGRGKSAGRPPANSVAALLASRDRALAPAPAPAGGLYLVDVRY